MKVSIHGEYFVVLDAVGDDKRIAEGAGFLFNPITRLFETRSKSKAVRLREYFDQSAKEFINCSTVRMTPWPGGLIVPPTEKLDPYQKSTVRFALNRNHSYLALDMRLGKTPIAITIINTMAVPTLITCPPFLVDNWKAELRRWNVGGRVQGLAPKEGVNPVSDILILPDSLLDRPFVKELLEVTDFGLIIGDEAHRFKDQCAKRTSAFYDIARSIPKVVLLSGTPNPNGRPLELWPALSNLAHNFVDYRSFQSYGERYCGMTENQYGREYLGASNIEELGKKIQDRFILRITKEQVLPNYKSKVVRAVMMKGERPREVVKLEKSILKRYTIKELMGKDPNQGEIAEWRKAIGMVKTQRAAEYVNNALDNGERVLLLGWHIDVIEMLAGRLGKYKPAVIHGKTKDRQAQIDRFQKRKTPLAICQISTMMGFSLDQADVVIFAEYSWTPTDNDQASSRPESRTKTDAVIVDYLVAEGTLDEYMLGNFLKKTEIANTILKTEERKR